MSNIAYEHQEYPKHITVDKTLFVVNSKEEEDEVLGLAKETKKTAKAKPE